MIAAVDFATNFAHNNDRLPPRNIEAEEAVLGGIMLDPQAIQKVASLNTEAFSISSHRTIYEAALDLHNKDKPTDLMNISTWLHDRNQLDKVGGENKLAILVDRTISTVNIDQYAQLLREKHIRRILISAGHKIVELGYEPYAELPDILNEARQTIFQVTDPRQNLEYKLFSKASLKISQVFHPHLAKPLELLSRWFPFPEEIAIHEIIPIAASLVSSESVIIYQKATGRNEPPIVRSALIAEASNRKTAIERIFLSPLNDLQVESLARHDENVSAYEKEKKNWDALSPQEQKSRRDEEPSAPPPPRLFLYRGGTKESIWEIMENQPGKGILHAPDEILQSVTARGEYNKGKGSDTESSLSGFNGDRSTMLRKGRIVSFKDSCSLTGGIQPTKLLALMGHDADDSRGEFARLLPCFLDLQQYPMSEDDAELNLSGLFKDIYQKIDRIPATTYYFSTSARQVFRMWHNTKEKERLLHPSLAIRGFIGKLEGYCAKFAMLLHILWEICEDQRCPSPEIPVERVHSAIALAEFYLKQAMKVRQAIGEDEIDPVKTKIIERLKVEGTLTVGKLQSTNQFLRKIPAAQYFRHFQELAAANPDKIRISTTKKGSLQIELVSSEAIFGSFCLAVSDSDSGYAETTVQQAIPPLSVRQRLTVVNSSPVDINLGSDRPSTDDSLPPLSTTVSLTVVETPSIQGVEPLPLSLSLTAKQNGDRIEETDHNFKVGDRVIIDLPETKNHLEQGLITGFHPPYILVQPQGLDEQIPYKPSELRHIPAPLYYCNSLARVGDKVKSSVDAPRRGINIGMECQRQGGFKNPFWVWLVEVSWADGKESKEAIEFLELDLGDGDEPPTPDGGDGGSQVVQFPGPEKALEELTSWGNKISDSYRKLSRLVEESVAVEEKCDRADEIPAPGAEVSDGVAVEEKCDRAESLDLVNEPWKVKQFQQGDTVRFKNREKFDNLFFTAKLVESHFIVDHYIFKVELDPTLPLEIVPEEKVELNSPLPFNREFGERLRHKKSKQSGWLKLLKKNHQALVQMDDGTDIKASINEFEAIPLAKDTSEARAPQIYQQINKGSRLRVLAHENHRGYTNKLGTVKSKRIYQGKYQASLDIGTGVPVIVNLEAAKICN